MKTVGKSIERRGAKEAVLGKAIYADDIKMEAVIHLKVVRSTRAHAIIQKIDTSPFALPGFLGLW